MKNTKTTDSMSPTEVSGDSIPTSLAVIPGATIPLQVLTKTIRSNSDGYKEPSTSENFTSEDNSSEVTSHQFHNQNTANFFSHHKRTQRNKPMFNPFTDFNY